jgi:hypothetical protein
MIPVGVSLAILVTPAAARRAERPINVIPSSKSIISIAGLWSIKKIPPASDSAGLNCS